MSPAITEDHIKSRVARALQQLAGRHADLSVADLAQLAGMPEPTVQSYLQAKANAPLLRLWQLFAAAGPGPALVRALDHLLKPLGYRVEPLDRASCDAAAALADLSAGAALVADALRDGRIDHRERAVISRMAADLMPTLGALAGDDA